MSGLYLQPHYDILLNSQSVKVIYSIKWFYCLEQSDGSQLTELGEGVG